MVRCTFFLLLVCCLSVTSVKAWPGGIADPYKWKPAQSDKVAPENVLIRLSAVTPSGDFKGAAPDDDIVYTESIQTGVRLCDFAILRSSENRSGDVRIANRKA